jgi:hypothetical protein
MESPSLAKLRFAVGIFNSWEKLSDGARDLGVRGLGLDCLNCVGLRRIFEGEATTAPWQEPLGIREFTFPGNSGPIACTDGPLAEQLRDGARSGASSLMAALALWLHPRHAAYFQDTVEAGNIQLWVRIVDADGERSACQSLLALSAGSVGVHDLVSPWKGWT